MRSAPGGAALALLALVVGCSGVKGRQSRSEWLARELLARHADLLARDPEAVSEKLARMARSRFDYFRGSADLVPAPETKFLTAAAGRAAVLGDPHPENIGTYPLAGGQLAVDFNDFDLVGRGSYVRDLRRLALGLWVAGDMAGLGRKQRTRLVERLVASYLEEIDRLNRGQPPGGLRADTAFDGGLEEILASPDTVDEDEEPLPADIRARLAAALASYRETLVDPAVAPPASLVIKRAVRAHAGVSSFPVLRYRVVVEGATDADGDDRTLELKEHRAGDAAAAVRLQRQMQERPDLDPHLGWTTLEGRPFRVRRIGPGYRRLSVESLVEAVKSPRWGKKDLRDLGRDMARLLARAHARPPMPDGQPGARAIAQAAGDGRGLTYETLKATEQTAEVVEQDLEHLRRLLQERGPLLGWRPR